MQLLGFGAEIRPKGVDPTDGGNVVLAGDEPEVLSLDLAIKKVGGTRHRSALRLCMKRPGCLAIVVSQDGDLTLFSGEQARTVRYPYLLASEIDLSFA